MTAAERENAAVAPGPEVTSEPEAEPGTKVAPGTVASPVVGVVPDTGTRPARRSVAARPARGPSLARSSGVMALGTIASRFTGFLRTAVLLYAIGTQNLGDAYNVANNLPNAVYNLALGGILTSVVVPLLVNAAKTNRDGGEAYDQRIFTLGVIALGGITIVATAAAIPITAIYGHGMPGAATYHLTVIFTYFFMPQIFFYGVSSLASAILNARGSFAAPMWTPAVNNVVVILAGVALIAVAGTNRTPQDISAGEIQLLGIGTTLGIVLQTAALWPSMRRVGFRWRPRFDFRRAEVGEIGRMSGWMFVYIAATQLSFVTTTIVSNDAGARVCKTCAGAGYAAFSNAWQLFQLPYAIVGVSVITAMLPRMSAHAAGGAHRLLIRDFSVATRLSSVIIVPSAMILAVLGPPLAQGIFGHGSTSAASARYLGVIFGVFCLGLLPYTLFNLLLRAFYAMHDSRTPALVGVVSMAVRIALGFGALFVLRPADVVAGLGVGFGVSSLVMAVWLWRILSRRVGGLDTGRIKNTLLRMHAAAVPGMIFAIAVSVIIDRIVPATTVSSLAIVAIGGGGGLLMYLLAARLLGVAEVTELTNSLRTRFGPGRSRLLGD
ncbi:MAG TPA: murein biosynthesis integral membrane protein MurJ [Streptosporangiaceae bacterium]|nr:murein biosynthesis integral membrane protein MurJ [Streptosporangiaceae bacterium]